jgi:hypothetical protein
LRRHRQKVHGNVEAVDEGHVEEIRTVELANYKLGHRVGWPTMAFAGKHATAVTCLA